jgi:hypothetical protein
MPGGGPDKGPGKTMWDHYIGRQIRRCNRNLLVPSILLLVLVLALAFLARRYLYNFCFGPFPMDHKALLEVKDPSELFRYYVTLKPARTRRGEGSRRVLDTRKDDEPEKEVGVRLIWDEVNEKYRLLLVIAPPDSTARTVSGALAEVPDELTRRWIKPFEAHAPQYRGAFLNTVCLDAGWFRLPGFVALVLGVPLVLFAGWNVVRGLDRGLHPEKHPLIAQLARLGPPKEVALAIQQEVSREAPRASPGSPIATSSWLLRPTWFGLEVIPLTGAASATNPPNSRYF